MSLLLKTLLHNCYTEEKSCAKAGCLSLFTCMGTTDSTHSPKTIMFGVSIFAVHVVYELVKNEWMNE